MRKILLTSAGFENKAVEKIFLGLIARKPEEIKALFIPTAAVFPDAIVMLPKCLDDLLNAGVLSKNITVFDLHCGMNYEEINKYDTVYFCGGDPQYLLNRINDTNFNNTMKQYVDNGGVYVGVSAGSIVATQDLADNLGYINCTLSVHVSQGSKAGVIDTSSCPHIELTDDQAILILENTYQIIE